VILQIIRHGKAEKDSDTGRDEDRPLRKRGERQASFLGDLLSSPERRPTLLLASPAVRARETARLIAAEVGVEPALVEPLEVGRSVDDAIALIAAQDSASPLALVGHNNQLEDLVNALLRPADDFGHLRTGEAAVLEIEADQIESPRGAARLLERLRLED